MELSTFFDQAVPFSNLVSSAASDKIETSPAGLRRHTLQSLVRDWAVNRCCPLEGSSITAPSSYPEMLTCCMDAVQPPPTVN